MFGNDGYHRNVALVVWCPGAGNINNYAQTPADVTALVLDSLILCRNLLNEADYDCPIAFSPSLLDWGGTTAAGAALNHTRVLDFNALVPGMVSDFATVFPAQPLITGMSWYDCYGLWSDPVPNDFGWPNPTVPGQAHDIVHPNELGYDMLSTIPLVGPGFVDFLMPVFANLLA